MQKTPLTLIDEVCDAGSSRTRGNRMIFSMAMVRGSQDGLSKTGN